MTAFVCLVFGYFFFWTIHDDFPPDPSPGPGVFWPALGAGLLLGAWALTLLARRWNRRDRAVGFYVGLLAAVGSGRGRRRRSARRSLGHRARPDEPRLSGDGLGAGDLDGGPRRGRA